MATVTTTFSQLAPNIKAVHTGLNFICGHHSASATICPSGVMLVARLPTGATLVDYWLKFASGGLSQTLEMGTSQTPSGIMALTTLSQTYSTSASNQLVTPTPFGIFNQGWLRAPGPGDLFPVRISLSDDAQPSNIWVQLRAGAGVSASAYFTVGLFYTMDGTAGRSTIR